MIVYPQLINDLELEKAKLGAKMFDRSELIFYPSGYVNLHIVIMQMGDIHHTTDRFLVTDMYLKQYAETKEELLEIALNNLRKLPHNFVKISDTGVQLPDGVDASSIYVLQGVDGFESSRILLADVIQEYKGLAEDKLFIATPSTDVCMIFSGKKHENLARFMANSMYEQSGEYALTPNVHRAYS